MGPLKKSWPTPEMEFTAMVVRVRGFDRSMREMEFVTRRQAEKASACAASVKTSPILETSSTFRILATSSARSSSLRTFRLSLIRACCAAISKRSEAHTPELQSLMRTSYDVFCLKTKNVCKSPHDIC